MIDKILLDANIEVEEFCLARELTSLEKANIAINQIPAEYKQIIPLKNLPENSSLELYYIDYRQFNKAFKEDYDLVKFGEFVVLFIYRLSSERACLYSNNGWQISFDLPNRYIKETRVVSGN